MPEELKSTVNKIKQAITFAHITSCLKQREIEKLYEMEEEYASGKFTEIDKELEALRKSLLECQAGPYLISIRPKRSTGVLKEFDINTPWTAIGLSFMSVDCPSVSMYTKNPDLFGSVNRSLLSDILYIWVKYESRMLDFDYVSEIETDIKQLLPNKQTLIYEDPELSIIKQHLTWGLAKRRSEAAMRLRFLAQKATEFANLLDPAPKNRNSTIYPVD